MIKTIGVLCAMLVGAALASAPILESQASSQEQRPPGQEQRPSGAIRVQSDLVSVLASVIDANGEPVANLTQDSFDLLEEKKPQQIVRFEAQTSRPLDLALMVDSSMSTFKDMKFEIDAASHFIRQVVRPGDTLGVFEFSEHVSEMAGFSDHISELESAIHRIGPGSGTSMYDAIVLGSNALKRRPAARRRAIVLVTDAGETTSYSKFEDARRAGIASDALLYSIVIRPVKNESGRETAGEHALITITDSMGGAVFILDTTDQLGAMLDRIDRELRTQYLLGYYPNPAPPPGSDRHIQLTVRTGDAVHYRKEYFTSAAP